MVGFLFSIVMHELSWPDTVKTTARPQEELNCACTLPTPPFPAEGGQKTTETPESRREEGKCDDQGSKQICFPRENLQAARAMGSLAHIPTAPLGHTGDVCLRVNECGRLDCSQIGSWIHPK